MFINLSSLQKLVLSQSWRENCIRFNQYLYFRLNLIFLTIIFQQLFSNFIIYIIDTIVLSSFYSVFSTSTKWIIMPSLRSLELYPIFIAVSTLSPVKTQTLIPAFFKASIVVSTSS